MVVKTNNKPHDIDEKTGHGQRGSSPFRKGGRRPRRALTQPLGRWRSSEPMCSNGPERKQ